MQTLEDYEEATDRLVRIRYSGARVTAAGLDGFNPYDGFAVFTQTYFEASGWHGIKRGEAFDFYAGDITVAGPHPFNSSRGNPGKGRTRTAMYTNSIEQLRGTAGERQIRLEAETAACGQVTPTGNGHIFLSIIPSWYHSSIGHAEERGRSGATKYPCPRARGVQEYGFFAPTVAFNDIARRLRYHASEFVQGHRTPGAYPFTTEGTEKDGFRFLAL